MFKKLNNTQLFYYKQHRFTTFISFLICKAVETIKMTGIKKVINIFVQKTIKLLSIVKNNIVL